MWLIPTVMAFGNAAKPPTNSELADKMAEVKVLLPPLVSGPKIMALASIAKEMAAMGNIDAALQVEAGLEEEPRGVLAPQRNATLGAISEAQERAGDFKASLATALRISQPEGRWKPLLALAKKPPRQ